MSGRRFVLILVLLLVCFNIFGLMVIRTSREDEQRVVYARYNDALVDGDFPLAWALGCAIDRVDLSLIDFIDLVEDAVQPLGGELQSWTRLRGGPEWHGASASVQRRPPIHKVNGKYCVRLGGNPLGEAF